MTLAQETGKCPSSCPFKQHPPFPGTLRPQKTAWESAGPTSTLPGKDVQPHFTSLHHSHSGERTAKEAENSPSRIPRLSPWQASSLFCLPPRPLGWIHTRKKDGEQREEEGKKGGWWAAIVQILMKQPWDCSRLPWGPCQPSTASRVPAAHEDFYSFGIAELSFALF